VVARGDKQVSRIAQFFSNRRAVSVPGSKDALFEPEIERMTTPVPKVLWIELTSKCPFRCVFCTRQVRWGAGRDLDFGLYRSLIEQLEEPEFIGLNYSGESIHYPRLIDAIKLACSTGAYTELVTALASAPEAIVRQIVESDLDRLAISIHTLDEKQYQDIYGFSSLGGLKRRIDDVIALKTKLQKKTPKLDFCFVAMSQNLSQLLPVCRYAMEIGASEIFIHPIIGRHPVPYDFSRELHSNKLTADFKGSLRHAVAESRTACPQLPITILNADLDLNPLLGPIPQYYAPPLPPGAQIHTCDQSPFESVHILANGDVVVCEAHDEKALGNLRSASMRQIWHGDLYREFRRKYITGMNSLCRECVWKTAYQPTLWKSQIHASEGFSPQLTRGWWNEPGAAVIWSKKKSVAEFSLKSQIRRFRISGMLPNDPVSNSNVLEIFLGENRVASIVNTTSRFLAFDREFSLASAAGNRVVLEFDTKQVFRPSRHSDSADCRDLGFALQHLELR
jgi:MoaA/NifB/PqqE/SkfB family radical SAM enzyme